MTVIVVPDGALVRDALELVWGSMLFAPLEPWPADRPVPAGPGLQATIGMRGGWNGRLVLTLDSGAAREIAEAMLGTSDALMLPEEEVRDAVGEVLNIVGGSVKGALDGTTTLGLPRVDPCAIPPSGDVALVIAWNDTAVHVQILADPA